MSNNPIKYTSRTYNTIINDINLNDDLADKPEWFKRLIAGIGDMLSMIENASANQSFLRTAFTERAVNDLVELIDYSLTPQTTSSGTCIFYLNSSVSFPVSFTAEELTAYSKGTVAISSKKFESRTGETVNSSNGTFTANDSTDEITVTTDFVYTGHKLRLTTTGTLPGGLNLNTDYFIIYINSTTIKLATSITNSFAGIAIDITSTGSGTHTWNLYSFTKVMYQQETKSEQVLGSSDGITEWQEFNLPDKLVLRDTLIVRKDSDYFSRVTTMVESLSTDKNYKLLTKSDNGFSILFGNGTYGEIPANGTVYASYAVGGGSDANILKFNRITTYSGGSSDITSVTNPTTFTGGNDKETIENAKILAPLLLKARNRFVTTGDGKAMALSLGGISLVKINKNVYGVLSVQVVAIATGGGNPNSTKKTEIQNYLKERTLLEEIDVHVDDATLTPYNTTINIKPLSTYNFLDIEDYIELGIKLFWTETGQEIIDKYNSDTLANTITLINNNLTTSFSEINDSNEIRRLLDIFIALGSRDFGEELQESDLITLIQAGISGIDYLTISNPSFPIALNDDEITTITGATYIINEIT
jgi:hypothetical protein